MRYLILLIILFLLNSCSKEEQSKLKTGTYKATLKVQDNQNLPFIFDIVNDSLIKIYNADEIINVDEITFKNDSVRIQTPVFEGYIVAKIEGNALSGSYIKPSMDRIVPFTAIQSNNRFIANALPTVDVSGNWETVFSPNSEEDKYIAKGVFKQENNKVVGTFRTTTGDYRYLEGVIDGDSLKLSTFDGAHAFLFKAKIIDSIMNGVFYSGNHWQEPFVGKLNNDYNLPNEANLTTIKRGYERFDFSFPDIYGRVVSLSDPKFANKVIILQIMGTWCPNCLDESKFLSKYVKENPNKDLQIISLAFEIAKTRIKAYESIERLKNKINIDYPILLAQFGNEESKKKALQKLPMLDNLLSFPTTIFIDKKKQVREIHSGFNGPATGKPFEDYKNEFDNLINNLLTEK